MVYGCRVVNAICCSRGTSPSLNYARRRCYAARKKNYTRCFRQRHHAVQGKARSVCRHQNNIYITSCPAAGTCAVSRAVTLPLCCALVAGDLARLPPHEDLMMTMMTRTEKLFADDVLQTIRSRIVPSSQKCSAGQWAASAVALFCQIVNNPVSCEKAAPLPLSAYHPCLTPGILRPHYSSLCCCFQHSMHWNVSQVRNPELLECTVSCEKPMG